MDNPLLLNWIDRYLCMCCDLASVKTYSLAPRLRKRSNIWKRGLSYRGPFLSFFRPKAEKIPYVFPDGDKFWFNLEVSSRSIKLETSFVTCARF